MDELLHQAARNIRRRDLLRTGQSILVAVSGGGDSMVLLDVLRRLNEQHGWQLAIAHLNHQLRGRSSQADERLVRRTAERLGLPGMFERADVRGLARRKKLSLEMAAREARHDFLARAAAQLGIGTVALAHHADDQLELFLLRLLRGSGGEGLAGMKWRSPSPANPKLQLVRPLLDRPKQALLAYAIQNGIEFREDATNASMDIQRNRIRHELLPLLRSKYQPALERTLLRVMELVGAEAEFATQTAREWLGRSKEEDNAPTEQVPKWVEFDRLPVAVQRRCLQLQLRALGVAEDFDTVEQLRLASGRPVAIRTGIKSETSDLPKSQPEPAGAEAQCVMRTSAGLVLKQETPKPAGFQPGCLTVGLGDGAGEVAFEGAKIAWRFDARRTAAPARKVAGREYFDADRVGSAVTLRHWRPGDRFQPIGMGQSVKLQDIFVNEKVLRNRRYELMVGVTAQGEIFWVEGLRISERFKLTIQTKRRLQWRWQRL